MSNKDLLKKKISIIIAVYQNEGSLRVTYEKVSFLFSSELNKYDHEIIFIDDGSKDGSLTEVLDIKNLNNQIKVISFTRNFGQISAIIAGFKEASGEAVINISADLQDPIELIPEMIKKWEEGAENVICYRTDREDSLLTKFFSKFAYGILKISLPQIPSGGFDFVLLDRKALDVFNNIDVRHRFFQGDILWAGFRTTFIPYARLKRKFGKSQWGLSKKIKYFFDAILDISYLPIRFISMAGFVISSFGTLYSFVIFCYWLNGETPFTGWAPIMIAILLIGGLIMIMLGVIGEYIWRIYEEVKKRPHYIIRKIYNE